MLIYSKIQMCYLIKGLKKNEKITTYFSIATNISCGTN